MAARGVKRIVDWRTQEMNTELGKFLRRVAETRDPKAKFRVVSQGGFHSSASFYLVPGYKYKQLTRPRSLFQRLRRLLRHVEPLQCALCEREIGEADLGSFFGVWHTAMIAGFGDCDIWEQHDCDYHVSCALQVPERWANRKEAKKWVKMRAVILWTLSRGRPISAVPGGRDYGKAAQVRKELAAIKGKE